MSSYKEPEPVKPNNAKPKAIKSDAEKPKPKGTCVKKINVILSDCIDALLPKKLNEISKMFKQQGKKVECDGREYNVAFLNMTPSQILAMQDEANKPDNGKSDNANAKSAMDKGSKKSLTKPAGEWQSSKTR